MKKLLEHFSGVIPVTLVILYAIAYVNLKGYYDQFGVSIEYYISLTDLLFFAVKILVVGGFVFFGLTSSSKILSQKIVITCFKIKHRDFIRRKKRSKEVFERFYSLKLRLDITTLMIPIFFLIAIAIYYYTKSYVYSSSFWFLATFYSLYKLLPEKSLSERRLEIGKIRDRDYITLMLLFMLVVVSLYQGVHSANNIKNKTYYITKPVICNFDDEGRHYSVTIDSDLIFIGETTDYIFLYDNCELETLTFKKEAVQNLKFMNDGDNVPKFYINYFKLIMDL